jgi:uncharacterized membrane protein YkvI
MSDEPDLYAPPTSDVGGVDGAGGDGIYRAFFTVSVKKFWVMSIVTLGIYQIYWFYRNWKAQMQLTGVKMRPFWRAVFYVFFTHDLFRRINTAVESDASLEEEWNPQGMATAVVVVAILSNVLERLTGRMETHAAMEVASLLLLPVHIALIARVQGIVNRLNYDPDGEANDRFSGLNIVAIILGLLFWLLIFAGLVLPSEPAL